MWIQWKYIYGWSSVKLQHSVEEDCLSSRGTGLETLAFQTLVRRGSFLKNAAAGEVSFSTPLRGTVLWRWGVGSQKEECVGACTVNQTVAGWWGGEGEKKKQQHLLCMQ